MEKLVGEWVTIFKEKVRMRAELLKNELEANGINVVVLDKVDHNYPILGAVELRVHVAQRDRAELLIKEFRFDD